VLRAGLLLEVTAQKAMSDKPDLPRRVVAEAVGTMMLLAAIVGSGIMGDRLAGGNAAIALLANTIAIGGTLVALILTFGQVSGVLRQCPSP
jgi:glycerol uptake facilitator-like aquaporin